MDTPRFGLATGMATLLLAASAAFSADHVWIGGDQRDFGVNSFAEASNWSGGIPGNDGVPVVVTQDCAYISWSSTTVQNFYSGNWTVGGSDSPTIELDLSSGRPADNPAILTMGGGGRTARILGSNTTIRVHSGAALRFDCTTLELDPRVTLCGDGRLYFASATSFPGREYGVMPIDFNGSATATGDFSTTGRFTIQATGTGGVNVVARLALAGFSGSCGGLVFGTVDNRPEEGNQSGFGRVELAGGSLDVDGDIVFLSDPDGLKTDLTPLTSDSSISGSGSLSFSGSFAAVTTKTPTLWNIEGLALSATGDGSSWQTLEVLSEDIGADTFFVPTENYLLGSFRVASGATVRLADAYDNNRASAGAEAMYVGELVVEAGATLDLAGLNVYARTARIDGTVVENGGAVIQLTAKPLVSGIVLPGTLPSTHGMAVGHVVPFDADGDGCLELVALTMDEDADDDNFFFCVDYDNGVLSLKDSGNWPARSPLNICTWIGLVDRGTGLGDEIFFKHGGWGYIYKIDGTGAITTICNRNGYPYGHKPIFADIDGDGSIEFIAAARVGTTGDTATDNLYLLNAADFSVKSSFPTPERNHNGILSAVGFGDLDGDGVNEIAIGVPAPSNATAPLGSNAVYRLDGTKVASFANSSHTFSESVSNSTIYDFDGDGVGEVFVLDGAGNFLRVYGADGTLLRTISSGVANINFAFADFDLDGNRELVYGGKVYSQDFSVVATLPGTLASSTGIALADFNGDQVPEVVYITGSGNAVGRLINIYDVAAGALLPGCPISTVSGETVSGTEKAGEEGGYLGAFHHWRGTEPVVADLDGNGTWEIIVGNGQQAGNLVFNPAITVVNYPERYRLPPNRTARQIGWYTHGRDSAFTGIYPFPVHGGTMIMLR